MTARQFEFLAKILRDAMPDGAIGDMEVGEAIGVATVILGFADALQDTNDNFDRARFIRACSRDNLKNVEVADGLAEKAIDKAVAPYQKHDSV